MDSLRPSVSISTRGRRRWVHLALLLCLPAAFAAGCGEGENGSDEAATMPTTTQSGAGDAVTVGGRVILAAGGGLQSPLDGVTVTFTPADEGSVVHAETDDLGRYSLQVPPGDYDVTLRGLAEGQSAEPLEVSVPQDESFQLPVVRVLGS